MSAVPSAPQAASAWVRRFAPLIPPGQVLDLACGSGRHARFLARLGHPVLALDIDPAALECAAGPGITTLQLDLERAPDGAAWPFGPDRFAAIVCTHYLHRALIPHLVKSISSNGVLIYETFADGNAVFGQPSNPAFLLAPGELLDWAAQGGLRVVAFEDGRSGTPKAAMVQRICAVKHGFPRLNAHLGPV